jgi:hypothetical protein
MARLHVGFFLQLVVVSLIRVKFRNFRNVLSKRGIEQLLGLLLLIQTFNLTPLLFDLSLLRIELALSLLRPYLLILQRIAHEVTTARPYCGADGGTCAGSTNRGADYRAGRATGKRADPRTFFTSAQRLPGTTGDRKQHHYCHSDSD